MTESEPGALAASLGWPTVAPTDDKRLGWEDINRALDRIAAHIISGTHARSAITGLTATTIPTTGSNVQADLDFINGKAETAQAAAASAQTAANNAGGGAVQARQGDMDIALWNRAITWTRQAVWMGNNGAILMGYTPSTRASKQDFADPGWTLDQLRAIPVLHYRYVAEVAKSQADPDYQAATELGTIADDLHTLGLWEFVVYQGRGQSAVPQGVHYELLGLAALRLAQLAHDRLDALEAAMNLEGNSR